MLTGPFLPRHWMGSTPTLEEADWVMVGMPYDGTTSFRPGTRFGPPAMRDASWGIETFSPFLNADLEGVAYFDAGDLELPMGNRDASLACIHTAATEVLALGKHWLGTGGEHLVTWPVIQAYHKVYPDLAVVHFDAHADLRDDYLGETLSHATVLRRIADLIGPQNLVQIGIRSGPAEEFAWMQQHGTLFHTPDQWPAIQQRLANKPVFLTIDLDVLDPSILPGTGTPEPGGMTFVELQTWLKVLQPLHFVGGDLVELSPHYDASGVSSVVAAKALREALLTMTAARKHHAS
jgi:agmatinase